MFRIQLENGFQVLAHISGCDTFHVIKGSAEAIQQKHELSFSLVTNNCEGEIPYASLLVDGSD